MTFLSLLWLFELFVCRALIWTEKTITDELVRKLNNTKVWTKFVALLLTF